MLGAAMYYAQMAAAAASAVFAPESLFAAGEQGALYDSSDFSTMFQDSAGTTPVTAVGQPVGLLKDKSGRGNHASQATSTKRPLLQVDGAGKYYLQFDGVDDFLITGAINFTATSKMTAFMGVSVVNGLYRLFTTTTVGGSFGSYTSSTDLVTSIRGNTGGFKTETNTFSAPLTSKSIVVAAADMVAATGATTTTLRVNGVSLTPTTPASGPTDGGTFNTTPIVFGGDGSTPCNGKFYAFAMRGALTSAPDVAEMEAWVNSKTGAY